MGYQGIRKSLKRALGTPESTLKRSERAEADVAVRLRSAKFAAVADLFRPIPLRLESSIRILMRSCPGVDACPVASGESREAAEAALTWVLDGGDERVLAEVHATFFGEMGTGTSDRSLPARAELYMSDGFGEIERTVESLYAASGFASARAHRAPSHIVNELEFMAYLLDRASRGETKAGVAANEFLSLQLLPWAVVFSAATSTKAEHPITRYAGLMLECLLLCETNAPGGLEEHRRPRGATA